MDTMTLWTWSLVAGGVVILIVAVLLLAIIFTARSIDKDAKNIWTVPDGNTFTLEIQNVAVVDQPRWPALDSIATPARMIFKMGWKSTGEPVKYEDAAKHFRFTGSRATCQMEAVVEVPSIGFSWKSDPLNTSKCDFAIIGEEVNGRYYDA